MKYHIPQKTNGTIVTQLMCAVLFCVFSFSWLYWFQADTLAVAQHVLSGGVTHYDRTIGAVLITGVLQLLQQLVAVIVQLWRRSHALTYLPSMLFLGILSDVSSDIDLDFSLGAWYWVVPLVLILWAVAVWFAKEMLPFDSPKEQTNVFSRRVWYNVLLMCAMMLAVAMVGNTDAVFHYRVHAEVAMAKGNTEEALRVGNESLETDENLTMLRVFALSRRHELGDRLFRYTLSGTSKDMLPVQESRSRLMLLPADSIWVHLGARPAHTMNVERYLRALERDTLATSAVADYVLCGHLIDHDIDAFVRDLPHYYDVNDSALHVLPRHYREALTLYTHLRSNPSLVYHDAVMDEDWINLQDLERRYSLQAERKGQVFERYGGSYWYYYFYH